MEKEKDYSFDRVPLKKSGFSSNEPSDKQKSPLTRELYALPLAGPNEDPYSFVVRVDDAVNYELGSEESQKATNNKARSISVTLRRVMNTLAARGDNRKFVQRRGIDQNGPYIRIFRVNP